MAIVQTASLLGEPHLYWDAGAADSKPGDCQVTLRGLPELLCCNALFLEAMFEEAGFAEAIVEHEVLREEGKPTGEVSVTLLSPELAQWCEHYFASCDWARQRRSARKVSAWPSSPRSPARRRSASSLVSSPVSSPALAPVSPPASPRVEDAELCSSAKSVTSDSEQSTAAPSEKLGSSEAASDDDHAPSISWCVRSPGSQRILWADLMDDEEF